MKSYHDVKISDIVSAVGLTQPAFYLYFTSEEAIFIDLTQTFHDQMRTFIENSLLDTGIETDRLYREMERKPCC